MLHIEHLQVGYGQHGVIHDLDWRVGTDGSLVTALLGPSGCGKSTLIRAIAGLTTPTAGSICFDGAELAGIPTHRRDFGVVFQDGQLFTGRSVGANIAYGLRMRGWSRRRSAERVTELLDLVRLPGYEKRSVGELSGGQAQRVALARALAPRPRLLLLDEPLAALDRRLRDRLALQIGEIVRAAGIPTIVVTHDHTEAALLADTISVMRAGSIVQTARPATLWARPVDAWTARFLGCGTILDVDGHHDGVVETPLGPVHIDVPDGTRELGLRPESATVAPAGSAAAAGVPGTVLAVADLPSGPQARVATGIGEVDAVAAEPIAVGDSVSLRLVPERIAVIG
ncbi:ABC transporter ATP-binding protein [Gordonia sinesedis]